jgi:hypothetical protein
MKRAMVYLVKLGVVCGLALFAVSCAGAPAAKNSSSAEESLYPAKIQDWLENPENDEKYLSGVGQAPIDGDEQFAIQDASTIARSQLVLNIKVTAAALGDSVAARLPSGESARLKIQVAADSAVETITNVRTVGPVKKNGIVYVCKYVERSTVNNAISNELEGELELAKSEIDEMLKSLK